MTTISLSFCKHQRCLMDRDVCSDFFFSWRSAPLALFCVHTQRSPFSWDVTHHYPQSSWTFRLSTVPPRRRLETLGTSYSMTPIHFSEERRPPLHRRESVNFRIVYVVVSKGAHRSITLCIINYCTILFTI